MVPYHTIAFSQQKLRAALRRSAGLDPEFAYGFVVHTRRQGDHPTLGLITLQGESMPLTDRLVADLDDVPMWLFGHARITLASGDPIPGVERLRPRARRGEPVEVPLSTLQMHIATFDANTGVSKHLVQVEAVVKAETLVQPLVILTNERPASWPA
ncbi:MAG TPA: hypothetical protein VFS40_04765 [Gemmatimonadales bacterium]|nr:hypothetical protein [Gemmatimonadales bacterium]